jgi:hypothetical protein
MRQEDKWLLIVLAGVVLVLFASPIGAVAVGIMAILAWLWARLDRYVMERRERKLAEEERDLERTAIPVGESILADPNWQGGTAPTGGRWDVPEPHDAPGSAN